MTVIWFCTTVDTTVTGEANQSHEFRNYVITKNFKDREPWPKLSIHENFDF